MVLGVVWWNVLSLQNTSVFLTKIKNKKLKFIYGIISQPTEDDSLYEAWTYFNDIVLSWIVDAYYKEKIPLMRTTINWRFFGKILKHCFRFLITHAAKLMKSINKENENMWFVSWRVFGINSTLFVLRSSYKNLYPQLTKLILLVFNKIDKSLAVLAVTHPKFLWPTTIKDQLEDSRSRLWERSLL